MRTFTCERCNGVFSASNTIEEVDAEARAQWGSANASEDPDMASVCDDCFRAVVEYVNGLEVQ